MIDNLHVKAQTYQASRNMAILSRTYNGGYVNGFEPIRIRNYPFSGDTLFLLIMPILTPQNHPAYGFYKVNDPGNPTFFGAILIDSMKGTRDVESISYSGDDNIRIFILELGSNSKIISVKLTYNNILDIDSRYVPYDSLTDASVTQTLNGVSNIEMIYASDSVLYAATNWNYLVYYNISTQSTFSKYTDIQFNPPSGYPTLHDMKDSIYLDNKLHEIKVLKTQDTTYVGCGLTRAGMCIIPINFSNRKNPGVGTLKYQLYEYDRTIFPDTIINPKKVYYDSSWTYDRRHKWDYRVCHSVLPYESNGTRYVLTTDEFTEFTKTYFENLDFYMPRDTSKPTLHKLNYLHKNHPRYPNEDPNKFQGTFLRIWDWSKLSRNDTTANGIGMILNAYDIREDNTNFIGTIGTNYIAAVTPIPNSFHEPYLFGDKLYVGCYTTGARILKMNGSDMSLLSYCDTEDLLSTDTLSTRFYLLEGSLMYAHGIYRLYPDQYRTGIVYGSDLFNGMYIYQFFDGTISGLLKHDTMQTQIEIGTVQNSGGPYPSDPLTFTVTNNTTVAKGSKVALVGNTTINFNHGKTIYVYGELDIYSVTFSRSNHIICKDSGIVKIGPEATVVNLDTMIIEHGGLGIINSQTTCGMATGGIIYVDGELQINSVAFDNNSRIVCRNGGKVVICSTAYITGLKQLTIEQGGILEVKNQSITKMAYYGIIKIHGTINANLSGNQWARFERTIDSLHWSGIVFDSLDVQTSTYSVLRHIHVRGAYIAGITTNQAQPTIDSCELIHNQIGILVHDDSPFITYCHVDSNIYAGLVGYYMSTVVAHNHFNHNGIGAQLHFCGNLWQDNKVDYNNTGLLGYENVTLPFNRWINTNYDCDTANGNGMRYNGFGVELLDNCAPTFECDNSVHNNSWKDVYMIDNTSLIGWNNYPDSLSMDWELGTGVSLQWEPWCNCADDPVLMKSIQQRNKNNSIAKSLSSDSRYLSAMHQALHHKMKRQYSQAIHQYKEAMKFIKERGEAEQCLIHWKQLFMDAKLNRPSEDDVCKNISAYMNEFIQSLISLRTSSDSVWLKNTATEILASVHMSQKKYNDALKLYNDLHSKYSSEPILARRALTSLIILYHRGLGDYEAALTIHDEIAQLYPKSRALVFAKVDLGLPLSQDDMNLMFNPPELLKEQKEQEEIKNKLSALKEYYLYQCYPNPFNPSTTIKYELPFSSKVNLKVFTPLGVEVKTLIDKEEPAGLYSVVFDGSSFSSGIYIYKLNVENLESGEKKTFEKKMSLVK